MLSMIILMISLLVIPVSQKKNEKIYKEKVIQISDYTIHIKDLRLNGLDIYSEIDCVLEYIKAIMKDHTELQSDDLNEHENYIYEINYPILTDWKLDLVVAKNSICNQIKVRKINLEVNHDKLSSKQVEKIHTQIQNLDEKYMKTRKELIEAEKDAIKIVNDLYITFTDQKFANAISNTYRKHSRCNRCWIIICCQFHRIKHL